MDDNPPPLPSDPNGKASVDLFLRPSDEDLKIWPHRSLNRALPLYALNSINITLIYLEFKNSGYSFSSTLWGDVSCMDYIFQIRVSAKGVFGSGWFSDIDFSRQECEQQAFWFLLCVPYIFLHLWYQVLLDSVNFWELSI